MPRPAFPKTLREFQITFANEEVNEFVFRHNRRGNPQAAFQTLLGLGTSRKPVPLAIVRGATDMPSFPVKV